MIEKPRRTIASSAGWQSFAGMVLVIVGTRPAWLAELDKNTQVFMQLNMAWIFGSCFIVAVWGAALLIRGGLVDAAHQRALGRAAATNGHLPSKPG